MLAVCPDAILLQYVNPMAINTWAISAQIPRHPSGRTVPFRAGHGDGTGARSRNSVSSKSAIAPPASITWRSISKFEQPPAATGATATSIPISCKAIARAGCPAPAAHAALPQQGALRDADRGSAISSPRAPSISRNTRPISSSDGREDLIEKFGVPLDEYPKRCVEQIEGWKRLGAGHTRTPGDNRESTDEPRIRLLDRQFGLDRRALGDLRQSAQRRAAFPRCRRIAPPKSPASSTRQASTRPASARCRRN